MCYFLFCLSQFVCWRQAEKGENENQASYERRRLFKCLDNFFKTFRLNLELIFYSRALIIQDYMIIKLKRTNSPFQYPTLL